MILLEVSGMSNENNRIRRDTFLNCIVSDQISLNSVHPGSTRRMDIRRLVRTLGNRQSNTFMTMPPVNYWRRVAAQSDNWCLLIEGSI